MNIGQKFAIMRQNGTNTQNTCILPGVLSFQVEFLENLNWCKTCFLVVVLPI